MDLILHYFHEIWAEILECRHWLEEVSRVVRSRAGVGAMGFAGSKRHQQPGYSEEEIMEFVVRQWKNIDKELGLGPYPAKSEL